MHRSWVGVVAAAVLLTACQGGGDDDTPDPEPVAESLADALVTGDLTSVPWTDETAPEAATSHAAIVDGMGEVTPAVRVGDVAEREATDTQPATATASLSWAWPLGEQEWSYATEAAMTLVGGEWRVTWDPALVEPSLRGAVVLDATPIPAPRGDLVGARGVPLVTPRPVVRFGIDRSQVDAARAGDSARQLARLLFVDPGPYVKRVEAAGEKAFVEALVLRREDVSTRLRERYQRIEGARAIADDAPARGHRRVRRADPGPRR